MIVEVGHFALILALAVALVQSVVPMWGAHIRDERMMAVAVPAALAQVALIGLSFLALTYAYVVSDFSVENVYQNSHSAKPLIYRISGVWGNHEGSMLLWVLTLALFGAAVAAFGNNLPRTLKANALAVQAMIAVAFMLFIVLTSNRFLGLDPVPADGLGLNPILQDPALAFHPPFLYAGYVGFSIAFAFAVAALIEGRIDAAASPLRHAPHTVEDLVADWDREYSREQGCFPPGSFRVDKYWPPVGRVDNVHGDRNLICTCPPVESYAESGG